MRLPIRSEQKEMRQQPILHGRCGLRAQRLPRRLHYRLERLMPRILAAVCTLAFCSVAAGATATPVTEIRRHMIIRGDAGVPLYEVTEIIRTGEDIDENRVLVHDDG